MKFRKLSIVIAVISLLVIVFGFPIASAQAASPGRLLTQEAQPASQLTPQQISVFAGVLISLLFSYIPGLSDKYNALDGTMKRVVMLVALAVVCIGFFVGGCAGLNTSFACTSLGAFDVLELFISALIANQATFLATPRPSQV